MIGIIDYGMGNVGSIQNFLEYQGFETSIIRDPNLVTKFKFVILPGIGSFDRGVELLKESGFWYQLELLKFNTEIKLLGICLGMQLLTNGSEEGKSNGLGFFNTVCHKFTPDSSIKIPHMGWNNVICNDAFLSSKLKGLNKFYFVHSFFVDLIPQTFLSTFYGINFSSGIRSNNVIGLQFHPEKSHINGMNLIENILKEYNVEMF